MRAKLIILLAAGLLGCGGPPASEEPVAETASEEYFVYVGPYTREESKGIYLSRFDAATGELLDPELAAEMENPSFLAIHPNRKFLYAVSEVDAPALVSAFAIDPASGALTLLNSAEPNGSAPCDLEVDATGRMLAVANYTSGSTSTFQIGADGKLSELTMLIEHEGSSVNEKRQQGPHAHSVDFSPDNRFCIVSDLGTDKVMVYKADPAAGKLTAHEPPSAGVEPGSGPRHFAFHPSGEYAYVINELASTITAFRWNAEAGTLSPIQTISTLPDGYDQPTTTAEIMAHPSGKYVYGSNRGHDSIAVFQVDPGTGELSLVEIAKSGGETPRNFAIAPNGRYLLAAHQKSDNIVVFELDEATGKITPTGREIRVDGAVCLKFLKVG